MLKKDEHFKQKPSEISKFSKLIFILQTQYLKQMPSKRLEVILNYQFMVIDWYVFFAAIESTRKLALGLQTLQSQILLAVIKDLNLRNGISVEAHSWVMSCSFKDTWGYASNDYAIINQRPVFSKYTMNIFLALLENVWHY